MFRVRAADRADAAFLGAMLGEAVDWRDEHAVPRVDLLADPAVSRYVAGWMRPSDGGVVAVDANDQPVGAAWFRVLPAGGAGFVTRGVPELTLGVRPVYRAQGIGRTLLREALALAERRGHRRIGLAVAPANFARRLYVSEGFVVVRTTDDRETMVKTLG